MTPDDALLDGRRGRHPGTSAGRLAKTAAAAGRRGGQRAAPALPRLLAGLRPAGRPAHPAEAAHRDRRPGGSGHRAGPRLPPAAAGRRDPDRRRAGQALRPAARPARASPGSTTGRPPAAGILSHGMFAAAGAKFTDTSPTRRGKFVRERLLCQPIPLPPPSARWTWTCRPMAKTPDACKIDRYRQHREDPTAPAATR